MGRPRTRTENEPKADQSRHWMAVGAWLFLLVCVVYLPALRCGFIWDDDDYVLENASIRTLAGLGQIWFDPQATPQYYPLVHTAYWIEYHCWELSPAGYHAVNVLLHASLCVLLWRVLRNLNVPGAWFAATIFGLHPVHVESVAWITERKNVLSGLCYMASLWAYLPVAGLAGDTAPSKFSARQYCLALLMFVAALLSKSVTCSLPAVILLLVYWRRGRITRHDVLLLLPWFLMGLVAAYQTSWLERTHVGVGAATASFSWTIAERCWIAGNALWFYLGKLLWPEPLSFFYPRWTIDNLAQPANWIAPVSAVLLPIGLWLGRHRWGRGPLVAALFFGGTLLPALGFVNVFPMRYSFVADHFQYLASLGPIVLLAALGTKFTTPPADARNPHRLPEWWAFAIMLLALLSLGLRTWRQQAIYRDVEALWTDTLAKNPNSFAAHFHLGKVRVAQHRHAEASDEFAKAFALRTDDLDTHTFQTLRGNSLAREGKFVAAHACLTDALRWHPDDWEALHGLANLAARQQRFAEAIELYRQVLRQRPDDPTVQVNLGNAHAMLGELEPAAHAYQAALKVQPNSVEAHVNFANALARQSLFRQAEHHYNAALLLQPDHAHARANLRKVQAALRETR